MTIQKININWLYKNADHASKENFNEIIVKIGGIQTGSEAGIGEGRFRKF